MLEMVQIMRPIPEEANAFLTVLGRFARLALVYLGIATIGVICAAVVQAFGVRGALVALEGFVLAGVFAYAVISRVSKRFSENETDAFFTTSAVIAHKRASVPRAVYGQGWRLPIRRKKKKKKRTRLEARRRKLLPRRRPHDQETAREPLYKRYWAAARSSSALGALGALAAIGLIGGAINLAVRHLEPFFIGASAGLSVSSLATVLHLIAGLLGGHLTMRMRNRRQKEQ